jgi:PAS domain S-box-containing protein
MDKNKTLLIERFHKRIPLTVKMVFLIIVLGFVLWAITDYFQDKHLRDLHEVEHKEMLGNIAIEQRVRFDDNVKKFFQSVKLFTAQKRFNDYIEHLENNNWTEDDNVRIKYYKQPPSWFPGRSIIRTFIPAHFFILSDGKKRAREIYIKGGYQLPEFFLEPDSVLNQLSQNQSFMTSYNNVPYIIASKNISGPGGELRGILTLACPIDESFIVRSQDIVTNRTLVALITGLDPYIIASNDKKLLPVGAKIDGLRGRYLIEEEGFFDYGNSDLLINLATFFPKSEIRSHTEGTLNKVRMHRAITNLIFIFVFALIMYWITRHIHIITGHLTDFSRETLGLESKGLTKGDQLHILKERFIDMTKEVAMSREIIKKQAEEQTRVIVDNAFSAIITTDDKGVVKTWNPRAEVLFGRPREEAAGQVIFDIIVPPQQHDDCRKRIKDIVDNGNQPVSRDQLGITCYNNAGHEFPAELSVSQAGGWNKRIFIFIIRDITERVKAETRINKLFETVTKAKTEWEMTFNSVNDMVVLVDRDLNIIRCNRSFAEFAKRLSEDLIGEKCSDSLFCSQGWLDIINREKIDVPLKKTEVETEDGRWLYVSRLPVFDEEGEYIYTIIMAADISELKNIQQTVMESRLELKERISELENFYEMAVNRELKMIALKKEIAKLKIEAQNNGNDRVVKGDRNE